MAPKRYANFIKIPLIVLGLALALLVYSSLVAQACTIFVLTNNNQALFCNNEDYSNPNTRIWFIPGGEDYYGCVYVGFDNGWAQGGMNTEGLAYDWVAGYKEIWQPDPKLSIARGDSSQRMLESCATIEDAIVFYQSHQELGFSYAKILVADRSGTSAIIGAKDGKLQVEKSNQSRGFGYGERTLYNLFAKNPETRVDKGFEILKACMQYGEYGTKYSNIFDLKSNDIYLQILSGQNNGVKLNLMSELKKGGHYYDIPHINEQLSQEPQSLLLNMKRFPLDEFKPIPDKEPEVTTHVRSMIQDMIDGTFKPEDYTDEMWKEVSPKQKELQASTISFGDFSSLTLVDHKYMDGQQSYRYRLEFKKATILWYLIFDKQKKLVSSEAEEIVWKPEVNVEVH